MKKLIILLLVAAFSVGAAIATPKPTPFYQNQVLSNSLLQFLGNRIKYPEKAKLANLQGSNVLLFTIKDGKLNGLKMHEELGGGLDLEVINSLLAYPDFNQEKDGVYALKTQFVLGIDMPETSSATIPEGYQLLNLTVRGYPVTQASGTATRKSFTTKNDGKSIVIRGKNAEINEPMYIVDGETVDHEVFKELNPSNVETITIVKAASAIVKYGIEAANGAVVITTKTPKVAEKEVEIKTPKKN